MRPHFIIATLAVLALPACEPTGGSSSPGGGASVNPGEIWTDSLRSNEVSNEQIFAVSSMNKPPPPQEMAHGKDDICPIHQEKMTVEEIPLVYHENESLWADSASPAAGTEFPFAAKAVPSARNTLLPGEPVTARVFQCPSCVTARRLAEETRSQPAPSREPE